VRKALSGHDERASRVDGLDEVEFLRGCLRDGVPPERARVVDQDVDPAELGDDGFDARDAVVSSRRSSWNARAFAPSASTSAATVWIVPGRVGWGVADLAATTTAHPQRASARQVSRPTPREPPVTMATLPRRSGVDGTGMLSLRRADLE
jgi:hypothetical protein